MYQLVCYFASAAHIQLLSFAKKNFSVIKCRREVYAWPGTLGREQPALNPVNQKR
jgi:hypothetical protein